MMESNMSRIPVRARIASEHVNAVVDGYVDVDEYRRAADGVGVRVHVERVLRLKVRSVGQPTFPAKIVDGYMAGHMDTKEDIQRWLKRAWLDGSVPCMATTDELEERRVWPPPGATPLFEGDGYE